MDEGRCYHAVPGGATSPGALTLGVKLSRPGNKATVEASGQELLLREHVNNGVGVQLAARVQVLAFAGLNVMMATGLNLLMGFAGQVSLGHAGFYGLGAYLSGVLGARFALSPWLGMPFAAVVTALPPEIRTIVVVDDFSSDRTPEVLARIEDPRLRVIRHERNRGVGSYLLSRSLEEYWQEHPGQPLGLDVDADNVPAIRLYRRQGFAPWLVLQTFELEL